METAEYIRQVDETRPERIRWWQEARFGMFVHWGLYSQIGPPRVGHEPRAHPRRRVRDSWPTRWQPKRAPRARVGQAGQSRPA